MKLPHHIEEVVRSFQRLQGVGRKTAERYVFDIVSHWKQESIEEFSKALVVMSQSTDRCPSCRAKVQRKTETEIAFSSSSCVFCSEERKKNRVIAIVASLRDLYSFESLNTFRGTYFLIDHLISPIDKRGVSDAVMEQLYTRIRKEEIEELFFALDSSPEGEATAFYISETIKKKSLEEPFLSNLKMTAFATGVPVGSTFEYLDQSTLGKAFLNRVSIS